MSRKLMKLVLSLFVIALFISATGCDKLERRYRDGGCGGSSWTDFFFDFGYDSGCGGYIVDDYSYGGGYYEEDYYYGGGYSEDYYYGGGGGYYDGGYYDDWDWKGKKPG